MEIWKPTYIYGELYEVSNLGNVRSEQSGGRLLKFEIINDGYLRVGLTLNKVRKKILVHRLVAMSFVPNVNNGDKVNHKDGNKTNNHADNLEWCSQKDNVRHAWSTGLNTNSHKVINAETKEVKSISEAYVNSGFSRVYFAKMVTGRLPNKTNYILLQ